MSKAAFVAVAAEQWTRSVSGEALLLCVRLKFLIELQVDLQQEFLSNSASFIQKSRGFLSAIQEFAVVSAQADDV